MVQKGKLIYPEVILRGGRKRQQKKMTARQDGFGKWRDDPWGALNLMRE